MQEVLFSSEIFKAVPPEKLALSSREDLIVFIKLQQEVNDAFQKRVKSLEALVNEKSQVILRLGDQYVILKNKYFGKSSERGPAVRSGQGDRGNSDRGTIAKQKRVMLPSERYPDAPLIERRVEFQTLPGCSCCGAQMVDSGMTEDSEFLTVVPVEYLVIRQMRQKVRCGKCHGDMRTAPSPERIKASSSYSDEMVIDVAMTKYCDLIPIERYSMIAGRAGLRGLPPHSLIESTHNLSNFVRPAYEKLKEEITAAKVLHADETPHRMLEGDKKSSWYLWGFSTSKTSYFEHHGTRSGDVASKILSGAQCEYLMSDVFSGYGKAVKDSNELRENLKLPKIRNIYCNAHARRKFKEAKDNFPNEADFFIDQYQEIYRLEGEAKEKPPDEIKKLRAEMLPKFEAMKLKALEDLQTHSSQSSIAKATSYFLRNYEGLTYFLKKEVLPIDNNPQERLLRNPVIGRKTWYGTHSKRGAETAAVLFSLVESCKLNKINPRKYFKQLVSDIHAGKPCYTPSQFIPR